MAQFKHFTHCSQSCIVKSHSQGNVDDICHCHCAKELKLSQSAAVCLQAELQVGSDMKDFPNYFKVCTITDVLHNQFCRANFSRIKRLFMSHTLRTAEVQVGCTASGKFSLFSEELAQDPRVKRNYRVWVCPCMRHATTALRRAL
jgi:hypothetical protein